MCVCVCDNVFSDTRRAIIIFLSIYLCICAKNQTKVLQNKSDVTKNPNYTFIATPIMTLAIYRKYKKTAIAIKIVSKNTKRKTYKKTLEVADTIGI